jgi:hypothetical protein
MGNKADCRAKSVRVTSAAVVITLKDERVLSTPISWHKPLANASPAQRKRWQILGDGGAIEWPELEYDFNVMLMLAPHGVHCTGWTNVHD